MERVMGMLLMKRGRPGVGEEVDVSAASLMRNAF